MALALEVQQHDHEDQDDEQVVPALLESIHEARKFLAREPFELVAGGVAVDLGEQADIIQDRRDGRGQRDIGVTGVHELRHHERGGAQHRRRQHGAGGCAGFDRGGIGRREAGLLHRRDGHGARGQHVGDDAAADGAEQPAGEDANLRSAAAERPAHRESNVDEEFSGAGHHQRGAEHQKADHGVGEGLNRNAEQALARQHVIGGGLLKGRLRAAERPEPFGVGEQWIEREREHAQQQAPAAGAPQRFHQYDPHHEAGRDHVLRRALEFPARLRRLADVHHQPDRRAERQQEQDNVVPGNAVEARLAGSGKDQEGERQHQCDQQIEIFGIELGIIEKELQRELLVDAQQDRHRGRDDQRPAPAALQGADARNLRFLHVGGCCEMRIGELDLDGLPRITAEQRRCI